TGVDTFSSEIPQQCSSILGTRSLRPRKGSRKRDAYECSGSHDGPRPHCFPLTNDRSGSQPSSSSRFFLLSPAIVAADRIHLKRVTITLFLFPFLCFAEIGPTTPQRTVSDALPQPLLAVTTLNTCDCHLCFSSLKAATFRQRCSATVNLHSLLSTLSLESSTQSKKMIKPYLDRNMHFLTRRAHASEDSSYFKSLATSSSYKSLPY
ncbi:hypothetical protein BHM03_00047167, partial [Ensete ventricosum]